MKNMSIKIQTTRAADLAAVAKCYRKAFDGSLSASLGTRYAKKMLAWFLSRSDNFLFHVTQEGSDAVVGFCGGMLNDGLHKRGSASELIQFAFYEGIWGMLTHPWLIFHREMRSKYRLAFRNLWKRLRKQHAPSLYRPGEVEAYVGLVVIGVDKAFQNRGLSKAILTEFESRSIEYGYSKVKLSVKSENAQAVRAYEKGGWSIVENRGQSLSMVKRL